MKAFKKFACNGTIIEHPEHGEVIQLQDDDQCKNEHKPVPDRDWTAKDDQLKARGFPVLVAF